MEKQFVVERANLAVSMKCSLKCKLCGTYSPYLSNLKQPSFDDLLEYTRRYFNIVDFTEKFTISGGEPLLFKQLPEVINSLFKYKDKIGELEIVTNGTIVPNDEVLNSVRKFGSTFYRFLVDDYGSNLSTKTKEIDAVLKEADLPYVIRNYTSTDAHCGGWVDFGNAEKIHTPEEAEILFRKCSNANKLHYCFYIFNGKVLPCTMMIHRLYLGQKINSGDYIDLMDDTLTIEQQRQKISNIYGSGCLESCQYCNGMCDDSPRYTPAEQLTPEEIRQIKESAQIRGNYKPNSSNLC